MTKVGTTQPQRGNNNSSTINWKVWKRQWKIDGAQNKMEEERVQTTGSLCHHWWILFFALFDYHGIVQCSTSMTHYNYRTVRSHGTVPYRYRSGTGVCTVQYGTVRPQSLYYLRKFFCVLRKKIKILTLCREVP